MAAVLVQIDLDGERVDPSSLVALAAGRHVASSWGATLYAAVIVQGLDGKPPPLDAIETTLALAGADKIVVAVTAVAVAPLWSAIGGSWQAVLDHLRPRLVLFGADAPSARELAPRTAARIGARLLLRARAVGVDDVELRDREGGYVRASDGGAAVAMIGHATPTAPADEDIDLLVLSPEAGPDERLELVATTAAEIAHAAGVVVVIGDDVAGDSRLVASAHRLAELLGGQVVGGAGAARVAAIPNGALIERTTPVAAELVITIGGAQLDPSGASSVVKIGHNGGKTIDGALPGLADVGLAELVRQLEGM